MVVLRCQGAEKQGRGDLLKLVVESVDHGRRCRSVGTVEGRSEGFELDNGKILAQDDSIYRS
jgi:urease accessory protein UreE